MTSVYEVIDKSVLPKEYLPDEYTGPNAGPMKQIVGKLETQFIQINRFNPSEKQTGHKRYT